MADKRIDVGSPRLSEQESALHRASAAMRTEVDQIKMQVHNQVTQSGKFLSGMGAGEVEFIQQTGKSLSVASDYYGQALSGKINLSADVREFGAAIGNASGQALGTAGNYYFNQVRKGQANLINDTILFGEAACQHWNSLDSEKKGHLFGKDVVPLVVPGAIGIVAKELQVTNLIGRTGEAVIAFRGPQLIPAYADGFAPTQAMAAAKIGRMAGREANVAYPGMLMMSQDKIFGTSTDSVNDGGKMTARLSKAEREPLKQEYEDRVLEDAYKAALKKQASQRIEEATARIARAKAGENKLYEMQNELRRVNSEGLPKEKGETYSCESYGFYKTYEKFSKIGGNREQIFDHYTGGSLHFRETVLQDNTNVIEYYQRGPQRITLRPDGTKITEGIRDGGNMASTSGERIPLARGYYKETRGSRPNGAYEVVTEEPDGVMKTQTRGNLIEERPDGTMTIFHKAATTHPLNEPDRTIYYADGRRVF